MAHTQQTAQLTTGGARPSQQLKTKNKYAMQTSKRAAGGHTPHANLIVEDVDIGTDISNDAEAGSHPSLPLTLLPPSSLVQSLPVQVLRSMQDKEMQDKETHNEAERWEISLSICSILEPGERRGDLFAGQEGSAKNPKPVAVEVDKFFRMLLASNFTSLLNRATIVLLTCSWLVQHAESFGQLRLSLQCLRISHCVAFTAPRFQSTLVSIFMEVLAFQAFVEIIPLPALQNSFRVGKHTDLLLFSLSSPSPPSSPAKIKCKKANRMALPKQQGVKFKQHLSGHKNCDKLGEAFVIYLRDLVSDHFPAISLNPEPSANEEEEGISSSKGEKVDLKKSEAGYLILPDCSTLKLPGQKDVIRQIMNEAY
ncbi:hypothetical protein BS17DRAFT_770864, partial [Gyrodon lividus]